MTTECVCCGWCCTVRACGYGEWDESRGRCMLLAEDNKCSIYDKIVEREKDCQYPMMNCGCSSTLFNSFRDAKLKGVKGVLEGNKL